jgi:hypothetical protein
VYAINVMLKADNWLAHMGTCGVLEHIQG